MIRLAKLVAAVTAVSSACMWAVPNSASADIFQWQYINPADPSQGKQPSTTLCPDGAGVSAVPDADLNSRNLTKAYLIGANLTSADVSHATLTNANFGSASLSSTNFTAAEVRGADFASTTPYGFTAAQLYSTASYQNHDLTGINFGGYQNDLSGENDLSGWNFSGQNLTNADFGGADLAVANAATLTNANFTGAQVRGASFLDGTQHGFTAAQLYSTASYQNHDLTGIKLGYNNLSGWNLAGQNLRDAWLRDSNAASTNFSHSNLSHATFFNSILTSANFTYANLTGANFSEQNLTSADFSYADLTGASFAYGLLTLANANFSHANLTNASLNSATLTNANFAGAEVRGADFGGAITYQGFTAAQLYSTASYQKHDLTGVNFQGDNLSGWNFAGQNLSSAGFYAATLTGANFTGSEVRGANFHWYPNVPSFTAAQLYSTASYQNHDLTGIVLAGNNLSGWNFAGQNLTTAIFGDTDGGANLTNANFAGAEVRRASFSSTGISAAQLYSTASYQNHDLTGIGLSSNDLSGGNFAGQNLTSASFNFSTLTGADLTGAEVRGASFALNPFGSGVNTITAAQLYSTASYQNHDLTGINLQWNNLSGWNFAGQNLTGADLGNTTLTTADLTGAEVRGASFSLNPFYLFENIITAAQLYSTASYQNHDLSGINLRFNNLSFWNFAGQNLSNANLIGINAFSADFSHTNLINAQSGFLFEEALNNANFTAADTRGAQGLDLSTSPSPVTTNLIRPDGHIAGLNLTAIQSLLIRNYHGNPAASPPTGPLPIVVDQHLAMDSTGVLSLMLDADAWDSTISFAPGIPVSLGGTLDLSFAAGVDVNAQIGRTFRIFDWTGVTPAGSFTLFSPYAWDVSQLYTSGQVTLVPEPVTIALLLPAGTLVLARRRRS